ncbi:hypothetical protein D3C72_1524340 [compost metagenome]
MQPRPARQFRRQPVRRRSDAGRDLHALQVAWRLVAAAGDQVLAQHQAAEAAARRVDTGTGHDAQFDAANPGVEQGNVHAAGGHVDNAGRLGLVFIRTRGETLQLDVEAFVKEVAFLQRNQRRRIE